MTMQELDAAVAICNAAAALVNDYDAKGWPDDRLVNDLRAALVADNWIEGETPDEATPTPAAFNAAAPHTKGD